MAVHYPGDVLGGLILGSLIGWFVYWLYKKVYFRFIFVNDEMMSLIGKHEFQPASVRYVILTGVITIVVIFISGKLLLDLM